MKQEGYPTNQERENNNDILIINAEDIQSRLLEFAGLMVFVYNGLYCDIDPFNYNHFHVTCDGAEYDMSSIKQVFSFPVFNGKSLNDIVDKIEILDW